MMELKITNSNSEIILERKFDPTCQKILFEKVVKIALKNES